MLSFGGYFAYWWKAENLIRAYPYSWVGLTSYKKWRDPIIIFKIIALLIFFVESLTLNLTFDLE